MDSAFTAIHRNVVLLDLVDEAWAADCLSDDGTMLSALESRASSSACLIGTQNSFPLQRRKLAGALRYAARHFCFAKHTACEIAQSRIIYYSQL